MTCFHQGLLYPTGKCFHTFTGKLSDAVTLPQLDLNNKDFGIEDVKEWVECHGAMRGRYSFFETFAGNSKFYQNIAEPLLPILNAVGSINVEHRVKEIKNTIPMKKCNCPEDPKGVALYRVSKSLKHII